MAAAELPSFYGQKTRDGTTIQHPRNIDTTNTSARDMTLFSNRPETPSHGAGHPSQEKPANDAPIHSALREHRVLRPTKTLQRMQSVGGESLRIPWTTWMHSETKNHFVAFISEFVGTTLFLFFAFAGTQVANIGSGDSSNQSTTGAATGFNPTVYLYIAICFGFSLMVNAWVFFRISGGLFNPAVTLALALLKAISPLRAVSVFTAQLTGACFAAYLVKVIFPTALNVRTTLAGGTSIAQGIFIEALCTTELVFTIIMLAMEKHKATFIAPIGIGLSLFVGELVSVYYTGGSLNPARSFGPSAVTHTFSHNDWIYWVGPLMGSIFAVAFYQFIKVLEYEMANPGQDADFNNVLPPRTPSRGPNPQFVQFAGQPAAEADLRDEEGEGGGDLGVRDGAMSRGEEHDDDVESPQPSSPTSPTSPTGLLPKKKTRF